MDGTDEGPIVMYLDDDLEEDDLEDLDDSLSPDAATVYLSPRPDVTNQHQAPSCGATSSQDTESESETELMTPGNSAHSTSAMRHAPSESDGEDTDDDFISSEPESPINLRSRLNLKLKIGHKSSSYLDRPGSFEFSNRLYHSNQISEGDVSNSVTDGPLATAEIEKEDPNCSLRKCNHCKLIVANIVSHHFKHHENIPRTEADYKQYSKSLDKMIEQLKLRMHKETVSTQRPRKQCPYVEDNGESCAQKQMKICTCYSIDISEFDKLGDQSTTQNSEVNDVNEVFIQRADSPVSTCARPSVSNSHSVSNSASTSNVSTDTASSSSSSTAASSLVPSSYEPTTSSASAVSVVSIRPTTEVTSSPLTSSPHPMPSYNVPTLTSDLIPCSSTAAAPSELQAEENTPLSDRLDLGVDSEAASSVEQDFQEPIHCIHCGITSHNGNALRAHFFQAHDDQDFSTFDASISSLETRRKRNSVDSLPEQADLNVDIHCLHCDFPSTNVNTLKAHFFQEHPDKDFKTYENVLRLFSRIAGSTHQNPRSDPGAACERDAEETDGLEPNHFILKLETCRVNCPDASDDDDSNAPDDEDHEDDDESQQSINNQSEESESSQFQLRDCYVPLEDVMNNMLHEEATRDENSTETRGKKRKSSASESDIPEKRQHRNDLENVPDSPMNILNALLHIPEIPYLPRAVDKECPVCEQTFPSAALANMHILGKHCQEILDKSPKLSCPACREDFREPLSLYGHLLYAHKLTAKTALEAKRQWKQVLEQAGVGGELIDSDDEGNVVEEGSCPMCGVTTGNQSLLSHIVWSHSKQMTGKQFKFKCSICDDAYYSASSASKHIREKHNADKKALNKVSAAQGVAREIIGPLAFTDRSDMSHLVERADTGNAVPINQDDCDNKARLHEMLKNRKKQDYRWMKITETTGRHCPVCQKKFTSVINNTSHIVAEHAHQLTNRQLILKCSLCDFSSSEFMKVSRHIYREHATHARRSFALARLNATRKGKAFLKVVKIANKRRPVSPISLGEEQRKMPWPMVRLQGNGIELTRSPAG